MSEDLERVETKLCSSVCGLWLVVGGWWLWLVAIVVVVDSWRLWLYGSMGTSSLVMTKFLFMMLKLPPTLLPDAFLAGPLFTTSSPLITFTHHQHPNRKPVLMMMTIKHERSDAMHVRLWCLCSA